jgi:signal transduction histidine kinase
MPEEQRAEAHLRIGMRLAAHTSSQQREEVIFEIVNQLNRGSHLIAQVEERERIAELNYLAARRAKSSTAYASALQHLAAGRAMLTDQTWDRRHELIFAIELLMAECELFTANPAAAESRLTMLAERARNSHDSAVVTSLRLTLYTTLDRSDRGVEVFLEYLRRGGTDWSPHPTAEEVRREYDRIWSLVGSRPIEQLVDLALMTDPDVLDVLDVFTEVVTPALFCDENLSSLVICRMVNISLERGNSDASCFAYVWFAIIAGPRFGNYKDGFRFGRLGYELVEKRGLKRFQARTFMSFGDIVMPWTKHVRAGRDLVRRAFRAANDMGDLTFAAYSCDHLVKNLLASGDPLDEVQREAEDGLKFAHSVRFGLVIDHITAQLGLIRTLRGLNPQFGSFNDGGFDELRFEERLAGNPALAELECWYWIRKLQGRFFAGDYASAVDATLKAQRVLWTSPSQFEVAEHCFYGALSHAASWDSAPPGRKEQHSEALAAHHRQLAVWAENCPENFENRAALAAAEIARIESRALDAEQLYEQSIRSAHANGFIHNEALANELAGRFYAARGLEKVSLAYLQDARYCYARWGAMGKVRQLDRLYPRLAEEKPAAGLMDTIGAPVEQLDLATVLRVSQTVSGEIVLEKLIEALMRAAIEHAGAERGLLILPRGNEQRIEAEATISGNAVVVRRGARAVSALPESIVNFVVRTRESVILGDAAAQNPFSEDGYIRQRQARSILCLPLINQAKLIGVLYLENSLTPHVFSPARIVVLKLLASQAAISLENARLYTELEEREEERERLRQSQADLAHINRVTTMGELTASLAHEIKQPIAAAMTNASTCMRWLAREQPDILEAREAATRLIKDVTRASDIISRIGTLFKKDAPQREMLDINRLIREMMVLLHSEAARQSISIEADLAEDLPQVLADRVQLQQVLMNLMLNGIEAMKDMGIPGRLSIRSQRGGIRQLLVSVTDTGIGLGPGQAEHIFDAFITSKSKGTGMGLPISRSIVEAHGGRIWVASNSGPGATFQFTLPVEAAASQGA